MDKLVNTVIAAIFTIIGWIIAPDAAGDIAEIIEVITIITTGKVVSIHCPVWLIGIVFTGVNTYAVWEIWTEPRSPENPQDRHSR